MRAPVLALALFAASLASSLSAQTAPLTVTGCDFAIEPGPYRCFLQVSGGATFAPYSISWAPSSTPLPGARFLTRPNVMPDVPAQFQFVILGVLNTRGLNTARIRITDANGATAESDIRITVAPIVLMPESLPVSPGVGEAYSFQFQASGGTGSGYTFNVEPGSSLPPGLTLSSQGLLSGTLTQAGVFGFILRATDPNGATWTRSYGINVSPIRFLSQPNRIVQGVAGQSFSQAIQVTGGTPPYTFSLLTSVPQGFSLSSGGVLTASIPQITYNSAFTVRVTDSAGNSVQRRYSLFIVPPTTPFASASPLAITSSNPTDVVLGSRNSFRLTASGGLPPYTYSFVSGAALPENSFILPGQFRSFENDDPAPGYLIHNISTPGIYNFTVRVTDAAGNSTSRNFTQKVTSIGFWIVNPFNASPTVVAPSTVSLNSFPFGGDGNYVIDQQNFPLGLSMDNNGVLSGTIQECGGSLPIGRRLSSAGESLTLNNSFTIFNQVSCGTPSTLSTTGGLIGPLPQTQQSGQTLVASGSPLATPGYTFALLSGSLPPGMTLLNSTQFPFITNGFAQIAGVPSSPGSYTIVYRVTDANGNIGVRRLQIDISPLNFQVTSMPPAYVGRPFSFNPGLLGATGAVTYQITSGALAPGLSLNTTTGVISGTPSGTQSSTITIQATDSLGNTFSRNHTHLAYPFDILPDNSNMLVAPVGAPASFNFSTSTPCPGCTWSLSASIPGLTINPSTGALTGTPTSTFTNFPFTVQVGNGSTFSAKTYTFTIYTIGGLRFLSPPPNTQPLLLSTANILFNGSLTMSGGTPPYSSALIAGSLPPGLSVRPTSDFSGFPYDSARQSIGGIPTTPGIYNFTLRFTDAAGLVADRYYTAIVSSNTIVNNNLGVRTLDQPLSQQLIPNAGTGTFALSNIRGNALPPGLTLSTSGLISGSPQTTGNLSFQVDFTSNGITRPFPVSLTVNPAPPAQLLQLFTSISGAPTFLTVGRAANLSIFTQNASGSLTSTILSGALPPGLQTSILGTGFNISGAPTTPGTYNARIRLTDAVGRIGVFELNFIVSPLRVAPTNFLPSLSTIAPAGQVGSPFNFTFGVTGGTPPYTLTPLAPFRLPAGLSLAANGQVTGTPTEAGSSSNFARAVDASGNTFDVPIGITIRSAGVGTVLRPFGLNTAFALNAPASYNLNDILVPGEFANPITWTIESGSLPAGLTLNQSSGNTPSSITGTPTATGTSTFTLLLTDATGAQARLTNPNIIIVPVGLSPSALPAATQGQPYSVTFSGFGGAAPYNISLNPPTSDIPPGLTFANNTLSGTPTVSGLYYIDLLVAGQNTAPLRYLLTINPPGVPLPTISASPSNISVNHVIGTANPTPVPLNIASSAANFNFNASASSSGWLSLSSTSGTTPATLNLIIHPASLNVGSYQGAVTISSAAATNSPVVIPVTLNVTPSPSCTYTVSSLSESYAAAATTASLSVSTQPGCTWQASTTTPFLTILSPTTTTSGSGPVSFQLTANPDATSRNGSLTIAGQTVNITQFGTGCSFSVSPGSGTISSVGGNGAVTLTASSPSCNWTATSSDSAVLSVTTPGGSGTSPINFTVSANATTNPRTATLTVMGQTFTLTQAPAGCTYSLSSASASIPSSGGSFGVTLTTGAACSWSLQSGNAWVTPLSPTSGAGTTTFQFNVLPNSSTGGRATLLNIAGQTVNVSQAGVPCTFSLSTAGGLFPAAGATGSVEIATSGGSACAWTAGSNAAFLAVSNPSGAGSATVNFTLASNPGAASRTAVLSIAGQSLNITQAGLACSYSLLSPSASLPPFIPGASVSLSTAAGCAWSASSGAPWLSLSATSNGSGPASIAFTAAPNTTGASRTGLLTIAGINFPVTQEPAPCTVTGFPSQVTTSNFGGSAGFAYTVSPAGCLPTATSFSSYLTIVSNTVNGSDGMLQLSFAPNPVAAPRSANFRIGDATFVVNQAASNCSYNLTTLGAFFPRTGGNGSLDMTATPAQCGPPPISVNGPPGMITLNTLSGGAGSFNQSYSVSLFNSFLNYVRTAQIIVNNGAIHTVKQQSW